MPRMRKGLQREIIALATIAVLAFALAILFGVLNTIANQTNSTIQLDSTFMNAIDNAKNFTSLGITIGLAVILVILVMWMVRAISSVNQ